MPSIDDQLKDRLQRSAPSPAGANDLFVRLGARRRRRATTRKLGAIGLAAAVIAGSIGGFIALGHAFRTGPSPAVAPPTAANGALVVSITNEDSHFLSTLPPQRQDLDPSDGVTPAGREQLRYLTGTGADRDDHPAVSPDGTTVAFEHHDFEGPGALWLVNIDGSDPHQIVPASVGVAAPAWSPDGRWIAFGATRIEGQPLGFVRPDGSDLWFSVTPSLAEDPSWSPDGTKVVFSAAPTGIPLASFDLWEAGVDPDIQILTDPHQLTSTASVDETDPTFSPDGSAIAFATQDGIEQMPAGGGPSTILVPMNPAGQEGRPTQPGWSPDGSFLTFVLEPAPPQAGPTVYALPAGGAEPFPLVQALSFAWQPLPEGSSQPTNLGLDFPICRVMSMPITVGGVPRTAYVLSKASGGCPKPGEGQRFVGADVDGDGTIDALAELRGCYPPVGCETFAAPDVNGDGTSEIAISNAGADGYGVWLFALTTSPPAVVPVDVVDPQGIGYIKTGAFEFAWVDVAGHAEGARCETLPNGSTFTIFGVDKLDPKADVRSTVLQIDGVTATVVGASKEKVALSDAPIPGNELCGGPLYGSAANFPNATVASGLDIGIGVPLCNASKIVADFTGDGQKDTAWVGEEAHDGRCSDSNFAYGRAIAAVDFTGDGLADDTYDTISDCMECRAYAAADLDGDGKKELIVLLQSSSTPVYGIYTAFQGNTEGPGLVPMTMVVDAPAMGLSAGDPLTVTVGGDEGYSYAVGCDGLPASPILVQWSSSHPIEGPGSGVRDVFVTKLRLSSQTATATLVDSQHTTQPTTDPQPFGIQSTGCGVPWFPPN